MAPFAATSLQASHLEPGGLADDVALVVRSILLHTKPSMFEVLSSSSINATTEDDTLRPLSSRVSPNDALHKIHAARNAHACAHRHAISARIALLRSPGRVSHS